MKKIEILAPVGSFENLIPAVFSGADAVYLGASSFSARSSASNFDKEQLENAVKFCHVRNVKVFVAVNTLIKDSEIDEILNLVSFLCEISVDALIVQDLGLFYLLRKCCPNMPIHCSTQMSLMGKTSVSLMEKLGAKRAVLAREMSLEEIENVRENTNIELEVFVHGALCMCLSGQCYFSAMLGGRSGNRGKCAQTCRLPFTAQGGNGFDLSLKDLSFIEDIDKLQNIGVNSAKIEGRMKRAEYVSASVTAIKNKIEQGFVEQELKENLQAVFSRSGFTKAYLEGKIDENMFGFRTKEDVIKSSSDVFGKIHGYYKNELQKVPLKFKVEIFVDKEVTAQAFDDKNNHVTVNSEYISQRAINKALLKSDIQDRFSKLGSTPYFLSDIEILTDELSSVPASVINKIRRELTEKMSELREKSSPIDFSLNKEILENRQSNKMEYIAEFSSISQVPEDLSFFKMVFLPLDAPLEHFQRIKNVEIGAVMPTAVFGNEEKVLEKALELQKIGVNNFSCTNLYAVEIARKIGGKIFGAYSLNITNSYSMKQFEELGMDTAEISFELKDKEILNIKSKIKRSIMVYGRQTLMITRACPVKKGKNTCANCDGKRTIIDRINMQFPVQCSRYRYAEKVQNPISLYTKILNSTTLNLLNKVNELKTVDFGIFRFTIEEKSEIAEVINSAKTGKNTVFSYTRGLFNRGVQ